MIFRPPAEKQQQQKQHKQQQQQQQPKEGSDSMANRWGFIILMNAFCLMVFWTATNERDDDRSAVARKRGATTSFRHTRGSQARHKYMKVAMPEALDMRSYLYCGSVFSCRLLDVRGRWWAYIHLDLIHLIQIGYRLYDIELYISAASFFLSSWAAKNMIGPESTVFSINYNSMEMALL